MMSNAFFSKKLISTSANIIFAMSESASAKKTNCFVVTLSPELIKQLKHVLETSCWELSDAPSCVFHAKKEKTSVSAYRSGKLLVQGKGTQDFVEFILEPLTGVGIENESAAASILPFQSAHAGTDESGKGDFFGPLVISCVFVANQQTASALEQAGARDSKLIKDDTRISSIAAQIKRIVHGQFSIVAIGPAAYNRLYNSMWNLNSLLAWGHARAIENMLEKAPECTHAISDQFANPKLIERALLKNGRSIRLEQFTKGERDIAVAAASILARDAFVAKMKELSASCGMDLPKGAGTQVDVIAKHLFNAGGADLLGSVAKMHFRTARKAMGLPPDDELFPLS